MKNLILTLIITFPLTLWGQGWEATYGGSYSDYGNSVIQDIDGNYLIAGNSGNDGVLMKIDMNGNELWTQTTFDKSFACLQQTSDGGYIITGRRAVIGNSYNASLVKTDGNGNELWTKTFGGTDYDFGSSVQQTSDGGYIVTGGTSSFGNGYYDVYLIKTDGNGNELWSKTFGGTNRDAGYSVQQTSDGGYIVTGHTSSFGNGNYDVYLIKTDGNGNELWSNTYGGTNDDEGYSVQQTIDDGYIVTGKNTDLSIPLIKLNSNGLISWQTSFNFLNVNDTHGSEVEQTNDGGYIVIGQTGALQGSIPPLYDSCDIYIVKFDILGNEEWYKAYNLSPFDKGNSVKQTTDGGFILCGWGSFYGQIQRDIILIKTDDQGNITSTFEIPRPNPDRKLEKTTNLKGQKIKPQTNTPIIEIYDDGTVEKKMIIE